MMYEVFWQNLISPGSYGSYGIMSELEANYIIKDCADKFLHFHHWKDPVTPTDKERDEALCILESIGVNVDGMLKREK